MLWNASIDSPSSYIKIDTFYLRMVKKCYELIIFEAGVL